MDFLDNNRRNVVLLLLFIIVNLIFFGFIYGFHSNNDTDSFIYLIEAFRDQDSPVFPNRYLNPFYAVVASKILFFVTPAVAIVIINNILYFGVVLLTYDLIRRVFKNNTVGFLSAFWVITGYAMLRYALTQVQDMGGFFWYVLTAYASWRWYQEKQKIYWLYLGGVAVGFGMLTKESGCMAALFFAFLLLASGLSWKNKIINCVHFSILPFITLIVNQWRGLDMAYSSREWFVGNWITYAKENYTFFKWVGVNASTFNLLWLLFVVGMVFLYRNRNIISRDVKIYLIAMILPSFSYFAWPLFISRTVFIAAWLILPIAAYGMAQLYNLNKIGRVVSVIVILLAFVSPYVLQSVLGYAHLFQIIESCHYRISCSWYKFWEIRDIYRLAQ